jgi:GntR family transcriptional regulator
MIRTTDSAPGDKIPSERSLSETLQISGMTVRRAIEDLVRGGVLERRGTSGTHVATTNVVRPLELDRALSISQILRSAGAKPGSRLLFFESGVADRSVADHLHISPGAPVIVLKRLRTANEVAICVDTSYLPAWRVPGLVAEDLLNNASLFGLLKERFGIPVAKRQGVISVGPILPEDATLLNVEPGTNVLIYRLNIFDEDELPIEHMVSVNHPQRVTFKTFSATIKMA